MKLIVVLLMAAPQLIYAQYFQGLYDADSSYDWGRGIFLQADGSYFVVGLSQEGIDANWWLFNMHISADGDSLLARSTLKVNQSSLIPGLPEATKSVSGGYITPLQQLQPNTGGPFPYSSAGLVKYNATGNPVFLKTYTDTGLYYQYFSTCTEKNGNFIGGGAESRETYIVLCLICFPGVHR